MSKQSTGTFALFYMIVEKHNLPTAKPANMSRWLNVGSLLAHCLRRRPNIKKTLGQSLTFAGMTIG